MLVGNRSWLELIFWKEDETANSLAASWGKFLSSWSLFLKKSFSVQLNWIICLSCWCCKISRLWLNLFQPSSVLYSSEATLYITMRSHILSLSPPPCIIRLEHSVSWDNPLSYLFPLWSRGMCHSNKNCFASLTLILIFLLLYCYFSTMWSLAYGEAAVCCDTCTWTKTLTHSLKLILSVVFTFYPALSGCLSCLHQTHITLCLNNTYLPQNRRIYLI